LNWFWSMYNIIAKKNISISLIVDNHSHVCKYNMPYVEYFHLHLPIHLANQCCHSCLLRRNQRRPSKTMSHKDLSFKHCNMLFKSLFSVFFVIATNRLPSIPNDGASSLYFFQTFASLQYKNVGPRMQFIRIHCTIEVCASWVTLSITIAIFYNGWCFHSFYNVSVCRLSIVLCTIRMRSSWMSFSTSV